VVFVTHDVDEALLLADRIVAMRNGAIVDDIPVGARARETRTPFFFRHGCDRTSCLGTSAWSTRAPATGEEGPRDRRFPPAARFALGLAALAIVWEILAFVYTVEAPGEPMVATAHAGHPHSAQPLRLLAGGSGVPAVADAARSYSRPCSPSSPFARAG
jgi:energy-coupling factor transporter ATP-binding protein EcfA2